MIATAMQYRYDLFIAYSHYDISREYAEKLYRYLTTTTPLRVFLDSREHLSSTDTTESLKHSETVVLLLTSKTIETVKGEVTKNEDQSMFIRELQILNDNFESDRIIPLNIVEESDSSGEEKRFVRKDLDLETYDAVKNRFRFLTSINYIKTDYTKSKFRFKIKDIIERLPVRQKEIIDSHSTITRNKIKIIIFLLTALLLTAVAFATLFASKLHRNESEKKLLLIGGGTAREYLQTKGVNPNMPNTIMAHAPSQIAWKLLAEVLKDSDNYHTVILSSQEISESLLYTIFDKTDIDQLKDSHWLIDIALDPVPLQVGLYPDSLEMFKKYNDTITVEDLITLINNDNALLVSTSKKSGTLNAYHQYLGDTTLFGKPIRPRKDNILSDYLKGGSSNKYIVVLQNDLYNFKNNERKDIKTLNLVNDTGTCILNLHLYAMVRHDDDGNKITPRIDGKLKEILDTLGWNGEFDQKEGSIICRLKNQNNQ
ncbi:MAG: hypothetical protein K6D59_11310 [Bacteroidales bacterium]|nr:hypothetical protein [Bacteroidales bacterium]